MHIETGASAIHEITSGSPVWCGDHLAGKVDRLLWDSARKVTELVVKHGFPTRLRRVPVEQVEEVFGNNVHLRVSAEGGEAEGLRTLNCQERGGKTEERRGKSGKS